MRRIIFLIMACSALVAVRSDGQSFQNGELDGMITGYSSLPYLWASVPYDDPVCEASNAPAASPDLTSETAPAPNNGVIGTPYSGDTYLSGVHGLSNAGNFFHEGIQQQVGGLTPGQLYVVSFWQCVDARLSCADTSGFWTVYTDGTLAGPSAVSVSHVAMTDLDLEWELRQVQFTATATTHMIKFLPTDDDTDHQADIGLLGGALSMGIDLIQIAPEVVGVEEMTTALPIRWDGTLGRLMVSDPRSIGQPYQVLDGRGRLMAEGRIDHGGIDLHGLPRGVFFFVRTRERAVFRFVKD